MYTRDESIESSEGAEGGDRDPIRWGMGRFQPMRPCLGRETYLVDRKPVETGYIGKIRSIKRGGWL